MTDYNQSQSVAKAVHSALSNDMIVQSLLGEPARLYDHFPEDPVYPYLTYGPMRSEDKGGDANSVTSHSLTLHIWSRYEGRAEILRCISAISSVLESDDLALEGAHCVSTHVVFSDSFRAPDGRTLHGIVRLNIITQPELETQ